MLLRLAGVFFALLVVGTNCIEHNAFKSANDWVDKINNDPESTWTAGSNFDPDLPARYVNKLLGALPRSLAKTQLPVAAPHDDIDALSLPKSFDSRKKWKKCKSLHQIRDQGDCGSCWAVSTASAFTDRLCIAKKGKFNGHLSQEEVNSCCDECGFGCDGGWPSEAWSYFVSNGLATGGDYGSKDGCMPYSLQACEHHTSGSRPPCPSLDPTDTPACESACTNKKYGTPFAKDHHKAKSAYYVPNTVDDIKKEIYKYGPVVACFTVYDDFLSYKKGVYQRKSEKALGGHAVKLIGWGVENNTPYWLVQNSWNTDWGDKGLFKIISGTDECGFESEVSAGLVA